MYVMFAGPVKFVLDSLVSRKYTNTMHPNDPRHEMIDKVDSMESAAKSLTNSLGVNMSVDWGDTWQIALDTECDSIDLAVEKMIGALSEFRSRLKQHRHITDTERYILDAMKRGEC